MSWFGLGKDKKKKAAKAAAAIAGSMVAAAAPAAQKHKAPRAPPASSVKSQAAHPLTRHQTGLDRWLVTYDINRKLGSSPKEAAHAAFRDLDGQMGHVVRRGRVLKAARRALWETLS